MLIRRESSTGANGLLTVYRPCTIDEFVGNPNIKNLITNYLQSGNLPHSLLLTGPAGCGKTSLARIIALYLNCQNPQGVNACLDCASCKAIINSNNFDVVEVNIGSNSGKAASENIVSDLASAPFVYNFKVIIFDECHMLSSAAKALLLKHLEDCYSHVYLIFCTNEPDKLIDKNSHETGTPFLDRFRQIDLKPVSQELIYDMLENVCQFEGANYTKEALNYISESVGGVPRRALNSLDLILTDGTWQLSNIKDLLGNTLLDDDDAETIDLCKALLRKDFDSSCALFAGLIKRYPVESIRIAVCGYLVGCLKKSKGKSGMGISNALTQLLPPIYLTGKPAEYMFYNIMFKVVTLLGG